MAFSVGFNPFQSQDIFVSKEFHNFLQSTAKSQGGSDKATPEKQPFKRMVDGWLMAVALGAGLGIKAPNSSETDNVKFIQGSVLQKDLGAIEFLMAIAIADSDDPYIIEDPRRMMKIAQGYAEIGFHQLKDMSEAGNLSITENIARAVIKDFAPESDDE
jgi:hypothetical protein